MLPAPDFCDPALAEPFARDGWLAVPGPGPAGTEALRRLWDEVGPQHPGTFAATSEKTRSVALRQRVSEAVVHCLQPVAAGLVRGYRVVAGGFMVKRPGGDVVKLHRHQALMDEQRHAGLQIWVPLQDTTPESGSMVVVPGSHRVRAMTGLHIPPEEEPPETREVPLREGEALVMDHRLIHGSRPNRTARERLAVTVLLAPTAAPLWFCHRTERTLDVYQVPDDFYQRWLPGEPPPLECPPLVRLPLPR